MVNSIAKGKRGERQWANWLKEWLGVTARRGQQFKGSPDSPDVVSNLPIHWEVKLVEKLNVDQAVEQAVNDCAIYNIPAVAHKRSFRPWLITIRAVDLVRFCEGVVTTLKGMEKRDGAKNCKEEIPLS